MKSRFEASVSRRTVLCFTGFLLPTGRCEHS